MPSTCAVLSPSAISYAKRRLVQRQWPRLSYACREGAPVDERHYVVEVVSGLPRVVQRKDVRVGQIRDDVDFSEEPVRADEAPDFRIQDLDRHAAVVLVVRGQVDGRHAPSADLAEDFVSLPDRGETALPLVRKAVLVAGIQMRPQVPGATAWGVDRNAFAPVPSWPESLMPQQSAPPAKVTPHVWSAPASSLEKTSPPKTGTGTSLFDQALSPSCPRWLPPQQ